MNGHVRLLILALCLPLAACTSTQDVMELTALQPTAEVEAAAETAFPIATGTAGPGETPAPPPLVVSDAKVRFAPAVGAPEAAAAQLAARLASTAGQRGIGLVGSADDTATHVMKGYFSAETINGETTVVYVWDLMDPAGMRMHRIRGLAKGAAGADGWSGVEASTMEAIADQTVEQLAAWLSPSRG